MSLYSRSVSKLPDRLRDLIEDELAGDETIVWLDQPIPRSARSARSS